MKSALFRVDGSHRLGVGHVMRCLAFAQGLGEIGVKYVFVIRDYEPKITGLIEHYGYKVETIAQDSSFGEDELLTVEIASRYDAKLILIDLSNEDTLANLEGYGSYIETLRGAGKFVVAIDGLGEDCLSTKIPSSCDIVVIPYYGAENGAYKLYSGTKSLLGPAYFIFRKEFIEAAGVNRVIRKDAQNILVTIGGSDPLNLTLVVAKALNRLKVTSLNLRFVIGPGFKPSVSQETRRILSSFKGNYKLVIGNDNMADLMLWSDLAITGGGLTKYELAVTGAPGIIISRFEQEAKKGTEFEKAGSALHLGLVSSLNEERIAEAVKKLSSDATLRAEMAEKGRKLVDGKGVARIISEIPSSVL